MASSPWPTIKSEREALAADLANLTEAQWKTPSLCDGWTVHQVLGHMTATTRISKLGFLAKLVSNGFKFEKMANRDIERETAGGPAATLAAFKARAGSTTSPPGPTDTWLGETIVHGEDIRRPLGISHSYPTDALIRVADMYKGSNVLIGGKRRIDDLSLRATDAEWSTGTGPEVSGPMLSLVQVIAGRRAALVDLSGEGLATLSSRA